MFWMRTLGVPVVAALLLAGCLQLSTARRVSDPPNKPPADPLDVYTFQIDKARETGAWIEGEQWIGKVPAKLIDDYRRWFEPQAQHFPPLWIYASARKFQDGGDYLKAAYWYIAARERQIRQLRRCRDDSAKEQLIWADGAFATLRAEMGRNPDLTRYAAKHSFTWLDLHQDTDAGLLAACLRGAAGAERSAKKGRLVPIDGGGEGKRKAFRLITPPVDNPADWVVPVTEIYEIRTWSRILMKQDVAKILGEPEQEPPTPTVTPLR